MGISLLAMAGIRLAPGDAAHGLVRRYCTEVCGLAAASCVEYRYVFGGIETMH